jgi:hypothetical protein
MLHPDQSIEHRLVRGKLILMNRYKIPNGPLLVAFQFLKIRAK